MKLHYLVAAAAIVMSLTACDDSDAHWNTLRGKCISTSSEGNFAATVAPQGVFFLATEPGCPDGMGILGFRQTEIKVNGDRYPAILVCSGATQYHESFVLGKLIKNDPNAGIEPGARAAKAFSGFFGADVELGNESAHFGRGNFTEVCSAYIPRLKGSPAHKSHKGFLSSLFGHHAKSGNSTESDELQKTLVDKANKAFEKADQPKKHQPGQGSVPDETIKSLEFSDHTTGPVNTFQKGDTPAPDSSDAQPAAATPSAMTPEMDAAALKEAQNTWLVYHPGVDISGFTWEKTSLPDKSVNGKTLHELRFTTTDPQTHITSDVDVEIEPDGTAGYAVSNDRPTPATTPVPSPAPVSPPKNVSAYCRLDNGKSISVTAADGQDYHYAYRDKNDQTELELTEGLFGVKAYHYRTQLGMGSASYIRFNKKQYDYVLISKDTGRQEFQGLRVYKDGNLISTHPCFSALKLDASGLTDTTHADSDKAGDFFTN
ncbi:hypothetical protein MUU46_04430 [Scandinavium sp. TWS1a]|uniref:hypothetical protein n=1 Tax=Scandinavium tedordense TaxID=2926521 RepID=UPI0021661443|nr:hypothetical protein [Scandinavium tedordense]MCS2169572.1 hypothetical protein [Scandinavium tedordense]